jgi:hypothetical protein
MTDYISEHPVVKDRVERDEGHGEHTQQDGGQGQVGDEQVDHSLDGS